LFAVGHLALGHLLGYTSSKILKTEMNIPLILTLSIIPDVDMIIPLLPHRGPTHSIIMATLLFIPLFLINKKRAAPYYIALTQHSLIGDLIPGGKIQLLWPLTTQHYGRELGIRSPINMTAEWIFFTMSIIVIIKTDHIKKLLQPHHSNLLLTIPAATALLPTFLSIPLKVPTSLIPPHLVYLVLFSTSIIADIIARTRRRPVEDSPFIK
jgi:membrane-bound metal-dependent hydrolase YbcI (DUF457 family)